MTRDPWRLQIFVLADSLVEQLYRASARFPAEERYGLQSQLRRAAISVVANIVEGSARNSKREYLRFIEVALGSASEVRYLLGLAARLEYLDRRLADELADRCDKVVRTLQSLCISMAGA
jgi:four helix bundle protein